MALNIPMPGLPFANLNEAINTGGNLFSKMMQPVLARENAMRQWRQHLDSLALQKEQMAHARRNDDLQRAILQERLGGLRDARNPMKKLEQLQQIVTMFGGKPKQSVQTMQMPTELEGEGMGLFTDEGLQGAQQQAQAAEGQGASNNAMGFDLDLLRQNPILRGFVAKQIGFDPLAYSAPTPQEKQQMALDLFQKKEKIKQQNKAGSIPTNKVLTQNQQAIQAIDTVVPMIDDFIKNPDLVYGILDFSPSKKAAYEAKTGGMIDMLVAAQSLPQVKESVKLVEDQIRRKRGETVYEYTQRLKDFKKDLLARRQKSQSVVSTKQVNTAPYEDFSTLSDDQLKQIIAGG